MSTPLYLASKMMLYQLSIIAPFQDKTRTAIFNETLVNLQNAVEAYETINCIVSPIRKDLPEPERLDPFTGSYMDTIEEFSQ